MSYKSLRKMYYLNKNEYETLFQNRFCSENAIHFNFTISNQPAFFFYHSEIMKMISEISLLDKKVNDILTCKLPRAAQTEYMKKSLIDEVLCTNEIEGIISTRKEINEIIEDLKQENVNSKPTKLKSLIQKYILLQKEDSSVKTCEDVRRIYDELVLEDIVAYNAQDRPDGQLFRSNGVQVKNEISGKIMQEGVMPESRIIMMMSSALEILNNEAIEPLVRIALFHYIFSYIHPFYDGNGRTNRYISSLYLKKYYSDITAFRLSLTIKQNKSQYYEAFLDTNDPKNKGDLSTFVYEFIDIVKKSFEATVDYLLKKNDLLTEKEIKIKALQLPHNSEKVLWLLAQASLFNDGFFGIKQISETLNFSLTTTRQLVAKLVQSGYLEVYKESRKKVYNIAF